MKTLTLKLPNEIHKKVCKLAAIAHRSPARVARKEIETLAAQGHDDRDLDFIIPYFRYRSRQTAMKVAAAANAFTGRGCDNYDAVGPDENGNFSAIPEDDRRMKAIEQIESADTCGVANVIPFQTADCLAQGSGEIPPVPPAA